MNELNTVYETYYWVRFSKSFIPGIVHYSTKSGKVNRLIKFDPDSAINSIKYIDSNEHSNYLNKKKSSYFLKKYKRYSKSSD
jgi:hypothetical protein